MSDISKRKQVIGVALEHKMDKTAVIEVKRRFPHPVYNKYIMRSKKYYAHDKDNLCSAGDTVKIEESKPTSKLKRWVVINIEEKAN